MSVYMGQFQVPPGTSSTFTVPPGHYNVTVYNVSGAGTAVYLAVGTSSTSPPPNVGTPPTTWLLCHSIPTSWNGYQGSKGGPVWAINTASTATVAVNYILSVQH